VTNPLMASRVFHLGAVGFGLFGTFMGVGGIAGNYYSSRRQDPGPREFMAWSLVFGVGFVPAGAFVVAAIATTAGTRWALIGPGLAIVVGAIAVTTRTRAAIRAEADTATAANDPGLP
jgi:hypothetical protein